MEGPAMPPSMLYPLLVMALAMTMLFFTLHLMAMRNEIFSRRIAAMRKIAARNAERENRRPAGEAA
jgi:heme exporter protein C